MAGIRVGDFVTTPGDAIHQRNERFRDDSNGAHAKELSVQLRLWDTTDLAYNKASMDHATGALKVYISGGSSSGTEYTEDAVASGGEQLTLAGTVRQDTPASSNADGDYANLKTDSVGRLWVNASGAAVPITDNSGSITVDNGGTFAVQAAATLAAETTKVLGVVRTADGSGNLLTATSNALDVNLKTSAASNISTNVAQINGVTPLMGAGNTGTGSPRVTLATDQANLTTPLNTFLVPQTSGGLLIACMTSGDGSTALTNTAQAIKASAGQLFGWYIYNPNAAATYVPIYNTAAASVTVGTTNPVMVLCIPATSAANIIGETGIAFSNAGWSVAAATTGGGNTAPTTALEANFFYK